MKKKILTVLLVATMAFALTACGGSDKKASDNGAESATGDIAEDNTEDVAPAKVTEIPAGYESINNVGFDIGENWVYDTDLSGTKRYKTADSLEAFAIAVQNEDNFTAADVMAAYKAQVETTYGTTYDYATITIGGRDWYRMTYSTDNLLSSSVEVNVYMYAEQGTMIYVEDAINVDGGATFQGFMDSVLESVVITE